MWHNESNLFLWRCVIHKKCGHLFKIDSENAIYEDGEHTVEFPLPSRGIHALMLPHVDQRLAAGLKPAKVS